MFSQAEMSQGSELCFLQTDAGQRVQQGAVGRAGGCSWGTRHFGRCWGAQAGWRSREVPSAASAKRGAGAVVTRLGSVLAVCRVSSFAEDFEDRVPNRD